MHHRRTDCSFRENRLIMHIVGSCRRAIVKISPSEEIVLVIGSSRSANRFLKWGGLVLNIIMVILMILSIILAHCSSCGLA